MLRPLLAATAVALAAPAAAAAADPVMFETPSRNIACIVQGSSLRCDMRELGNAAAPKPDSCEFDYGHAFGITKNGRKGRRLCISDAVGGSGTPVVGYGRTWRRGTFTCTVKRSGVRCKNRGGHGFELRRGLQKLF